MRHLLYIATLLIAGCRYADFPTQPSDTPIRWDTNSSIAQLGETAVPIAQNIVVEGVVVANDSTGNFFKQIILVDRSLRSSLAVSIGYYDSYSQFPQNALVAVCLKGLILKKVDGLLTAGYPCLPSDTIPAPISTLSLASLHLNVQERNIAFCPPTRRFDELTLSDIGLPFRFNGVYFESAIGTFSGERTLCRIEQDTIATLYTSPYASFATDATPTKSFDLVAVIAAYKNSLQLKITAPNFAFYPSKLNTNE